MKRLLFIALLVVFGCEDKDTNIYPPPACAPAPPSCADGIDNNGDGNTDDADSGCVSSLNSAGATCYPDATGEFYLPFCNDGVNNDSISYSYCGYYTLIDTLTDLDDPDCRLSDGGAGELYFSPAPLIGCNDDIDNDGDGLIDCDDPDCQEGGTGEYVGEHWCFWNGCCDGKDNDCDGLTDLDDPDCQAGGFGEFEPPVVIPTFTFSPNSCSDGLDNDWDGLIDCDDPDCQVSEPSDNLTEEAPPPPYCIDGINNDGDDLTDYDDPDCPDSTQFEECYAHFVELCDPYSQICELQLITDLQVCEDIYNECSWGCNPWEDCEILRASGLQVCEDNKTFGLQQGCAETFYECVDLCGGSDECIEMCYEANQVCIADVEAAYEACIADVEAAYEECIIIIIPPPGCWQCDIIYMDCISSAEAAYQECINCPSNYRKMCINALCTCDSVADN